MAIVGRYDEASTPDAQQIVFSHQPQKPLVIDDPTVALQKPRYSAVSTVTILHRQSLYCIAQRQLFLFGFAFPPTAIVTRSAHRRCFAQFTNR
jgi:hypothetical protein